jgi:GT2 family glycosyltransferase
MSHIQIYNEDGSLIPLEQILTKDSQQVEVCAIIVNRDRPDLTDALVEQVKEMGESYDISVEVVVVEMGSTERSKYETIFYDDTNFSGKCYGHNVGLRYALQTGNYKYFWFLMNDLVFDDTNSLKELIRVYEQNEDIAILSPTELESGYPGCRPRAGRDYHVVSTTDYLALLMSHDNIRQIGFLNPVFKYSWGAIHELAFKANRNRKYVAYCDAVNMKHLGGTTYGKTKNVVSREEYQKKAKAFAADYFRNTYGKFWDRLFTSYLPENAETNNFITHKKFWES